MPVASTRASGEIASFPMIAPEGSRAANFAFDVTPSRYVRGLITERGVCAASAKALAQLRGNEEEGVAEDMPN